MMGFAKKKGPQQNLYSLESEVQNFSQRGAKHRPTTKNRGVDDQQLDTEPSAPWSEWMAAH